MIHNDNIIKIITSVTHSLVQNASGPFLTHQTDENWAKIEMGLK